MSVKVSSLVWEHAPADVRGSELLVLLVLADQANDDGDHAWPSLATIARKTKLDARSVRRHLRRLEGRQLITCELQAGGTRHTRDDRRPNRYRVLVENLDHGGTLVSSRASRGDTDTPPRGDTGVRPSHVNGGTPVSPDPPSSTHPWEPTQRAAARDGSGDGDISVVMSTVADWMPPGSGPMDRDRNVPAAEELVAELLGRGWRPADLLNACATPPPVVRYPATWMITRLLPLRDRNSPHEVAEARATETVDRLDQALPAAATPMPEHLRQAFRRPKE